MAELSSTKPDGDASPMFVRFAWGLLAYTLFVVLFGAWVRITGSGAGCGQHWPTCHGQVVPRSPTVETVIEFSHRASSGLYGILVFGLLIWALRRFPRGHLARTGAWLTLVFTITEALVGAGLVKRGLVADDASMERAIMMALHLVNTSFLTGALALTCWAGGRRGQLQWRRNRTRGLLMLGLLVALTLVGTSGAITALGDTLFPYADPGSGLGERLAADQSSGAHFLQRMRVLHPMLAIGVGALVLIVAQNLASRDATAGVRRWGNFVALAVVVQVAAGALNVTLSAPGWMQIVHLALGTILWVGVVLLATSVLEERR